MSIVSRQISTLLPREMSLLLTCARIEVDAETARRIREAAGQPLDWDYLVETSLTHGLMPLLYQNLKAHCADIVPADSLDRLKDLFQKNAAHTVLLTGELFKILD